MLYAMQVLKTLKLRKRFRPQQGLLIMNLLEEIKLQGRLKDLVSVPNRGYLL